MYIFFLPIATTLLTTLKHIHSRHFYTRSCAIQLSPFCLNIHHFHTTQLLRSKNMNYRSKPRRLGPSFNCTVHCMLREVKNATASLALNRYDLCR
uniref:Putative secreted peptide n=1 Tax=Anopheles braziliensis TaxID=58242 RepID=A0A2M3ZRD1_9DIPT